MRAVMIHKADGPDAITVGERPVRQPGPGEVLLRVRAAAVNPADIVMWRTLGGGSVQPPFTAGMDAAGVAEAVGPGVDHIAAGQRAMAAVFPAAPRAAPRPNSLSSRQPRLSRSPKLSTPSQPRRCR